MRVVADASVLSNHGKALICVAREPGTRLRDIAECLGVTERSAQRIVSDLCDQGYVTRERRGARNHYEVQHDRTLGDPLLKDLGIGELLALLGARQEPVRQSQ